MFLKRTSNSGFTLIELMVAMAILAVLVMMLARMLGSGSAAFNRGTNITEVDNSARAVLDFIRKDVSNAIWDEQSMALAVEPDNSSGIASLADFSSCGLYLQNAALLPKVTSNGVARQVQAVHYYVLQDEGTQQYKLVRTAVRDVDLPLVDSSAAWKWWKDSLYTSELVLGADDDEAQLLAENVVSFRVFFGYGDPLNPTISSNVYTPLSDGTGEQLLFLDVVLELLDAESAREVELKASSDIEAAREHAAVRKRIYTSRINFNNKYGNSSWSL